MWYISIITAKEDKSLNVTFLGQAGLLFDFDGVSVMIDPYLSDSVAKINPENSRRQPIDTAFFDIKPDVLVLTHDHLDHTDPETLRIIFEKHDGICVLASKNAWSRARKFGGKNNYVCFNRRTVWTEKGIRFEAVHAEHSDDSAIGVIITYGGKNYYVTGDTLYNKDVLSDINVTIDTVFLPINGVGNNMNMNDAAAFAEDIGAKFAVPVHFGLFDDIDPEKFPFKNKIIPQIYKKIR